jgi:hypothetical protein
MKQAAVCVTLYLDTKILTLLTSDPFDPLEFSFLLLCTYIDR